MFAKQNNLRSEPIRRMVAFGESTTWGYSVSHKNKCWVNLVAALIEEFQGTPLECINQAIGANVITTECPSYPFSCGPAALERLDEDVLALEPDLLILSYGLNDSRGGTPPEVFRGAYQDLVDRVRAKANPIIVALNTYYMHEVCYRECPHWEESNSEVTEVYNLVIRQLAEKNGLILADIYAAEVGVDWLVDEDHCHPNDLGHRLIAHRVFEAIARNCSFVARTMPKESLLQSFALQNWVGPDRPGPLSLSRTPRKPEAQK